jgi:hypothetical protein
MYAYEWQVFISYLMQDIFAIAICLLLLAMHSCLLLGGLDRTPLPLGLKKTASLILRTRKHIDNQIGVLTHILVEFQEAQCYFMIVSQGAVLTTITSNPNAFGATSFAQLEINQSLCVLIGYAGLLPTTYVALNLEAFGRNSLYTLGISGMSLITGTVTLAAILWANSAYTNAAAGTLSTINGLERLTDCGGLSPPVVYCTFGIIVDPVQGLFPILSGVQGTVGLLPAFDPLVLYFWIVFLAILFRNLPFCQRWKLAWTAYFRESAWMRSFRESAWIRSFQESAWIQYFRGAAWMQYWSMPGLILGLVHTSFLIIMTLHVANLLELKSFISQNVWNLGQIIAVTIWAPVICKLVYSALCKSSHLLDHLLRLKMSTGGLEDNAKVRYGFPYKLINTQSGAEVVDREKTMVKGEGREGGIVVEERYAGGEISPA